ncbi:MAG: NADH:flavin oxidoreductase [Chloroflexi bacterium]|nr:NADH:flavin oxidoreductase [Chloroflexota bacterium]
MVHLFDAIEIKGLRLKNRLVMAPMETRMATPEGEVTERHITHYTDRARGGVGLIIVEHTYVFPNGKLSNGQLGLYDDRLVAGFRRLTDAVHNGGSRIAMQLTHAGASTSRATIGEQSVAPWTVPTRVVTEAPRPLTIPEIGAIVTAFGEAARRAIDAGFDAVELHGAHGFLINQFLSPHSNRRDDEYGGSLQGRLRFPLEVIREVKKMLPQHSPLFYRLGANDMIEDGLTAEDGKQIAPRLEAAGVDVIDISGGLGGSGREHFTEQGYFIPLAQGIKEKVSVPVIGVGNITEAQYADTIVQEGRVDLVAIGRKLLSTPDFPRLAAKELGVSGY